MVESAANASLVEDTMVVEPLDTKTLAKGEEKGTKQNEAIPDGWPHIIRATFVYAKSSRLEGLPLREGLRTLAVQVYGMHALLGKLKRLKITLKTWNKDTFGNVYDYILSAENCLKLWEVEFQIVPSEENCYSLHHAEAELLWHVKNEEEFVRQDVDSKSKFFNATLREKHAKFSTHGIKGSASQWLENSQAIQD
ncbi:hypothetical protein ACH5RR_026291 [Cinchona calisaya]|uniref:Uncharacterized protein n=1 Tax=Cinchona calisaya TaxID=153742 RepID=A0ABD2Z3A5_9GENT